MVLSHQENMLHKTGIRLTLSDRSRMDGGASLPILIITMRKKG
jgi:hypothetical protein